jgi:hypothetical protein
MKAAIQNTVDGNNTNTSDGNNIQFRLWRQYRTQVAAATISKAGCDGDTGVINNAELL